MKRAGPGGTLVIPALGGRDKHISGGSQTSHPKLFDEFQASERQVPEDT